MIIKKEKKGSIFVYTVRADHTDEEIEKRVNTLVTPAQIQTILKHSCDVYTESGQLLIRFRKRALTDKNTVLFFDNVNDFAHQTSNNRGNTTGMKKGETMWTKKHVMSNIFGFFDRWSPKQSFVFNKTNIHPKVEVRECWFNTEHPDKYANAVPLIREIDRQYKALAPAHYAAQKKKANETVFRIADTAFTTVTTNINFQTTLHRDKGDDAEGFGNLVVFETGTYTGGETCMPQYGLGVDVRQGDFLLMDVHQLHGNLPIRLQKGAERMSVVCYLRNRVWQRTRGKPFSFLQTQRNTVKRALQKNREAAIGKVASAKKEKTRKIKDMLSFRTLQRRL